MKIGILMLRFPPGFESPVLTGTIRLLTEWGAQVDVIYPEENLVKLSKVRPEHDLYVLKSRTEMALAYAGVLYGMGASTLNPYPAAAIMRHRISSASMLLKAGVPVPETVVTAHPERLTDLLADGPLAIKLYRGTGVRGVHVIWDAEELEDVPTNQGPIFAQRFIPRPKHVRKLYMISGEIFGIEQGWPARDREEKMGKPFTITPKLRDITLRCAETFGVETFGLSVVGKGDDVYVVDINSFPDFKGVPDASLRLADFIYDSCRRVMRGEMLSGTLLTQRAK
jgi:ribosomal protein S6--L-glutamate ligase